MGRVFGGFSSTSAAGPLLCDRGRGRGVSICRSSPSPLLMMPPPRLWPDGESGRIGLIRFHLVASKSSGRRQNLGSRDGVCCAHVLSPPPPAPVGVRQGMQGPVRMAGLSLVGLVLKREMVGAPVHVHLWHSNGILHILSYLDSR